MIPHSHPIVPEEDIAAVADTLRAGHLAQGEEVARLEQTLSQAMGDADVVCVSSGTAALYLSLLAVGMRPGARIALPSYTCNSLYAAATLARADVVCADAARDGINPGAEEMRAVEGGGLDAVIASHTCGFRCDIEGLQQRGAPVIEDCAHAFGGTDADGTPLGGKGSIAILSFYATKLLPAGEGGAMVTRDPAWAACVRAWRDCDERVPDPRAFNFKLSDLHAVLARRRAERIQEEHLRRNQLARHYDACFGERSFRASAGQEQAVCYRYLVEPVGSADHFIAAAEEAGITCKRPIWRPLHRALGGACPRTDRWFNQLVSVPLYPGLSDAEVERICNTLPQLAEE